MHPACNVCLQPVHGLQNLHEPVPPEAQLTTAAGCCNFTCRLWLGDYSCDLHMKLKLQILAEEVASVVSQQGIHHGHCCAAAMAVLMSAAPGSGVTQRRAAPACDLATAHQSLPLLVITGCRPTGCWWQGPTSSMCT